jgi:putative membrane-bound dehydrogenase-like protein
MFLLMKNWIRATLPRFFLVAFLCCLSIGIQKTGGTDPKPQSPVAPADSLKWLETQAGFRVELVAAEPQVVDPVAMQIDEQGRIWVVEMRDYPTEDDSPKSRIVVLQDNDQDGFYESSKVFADKLRFATGVQPWQNGALVTVQGQLLMLRDTDGDLQADTQEVWLEGFASGNPQLRANHPTIAPDGWLYIASGLRGGKIKQSIPFANRDSRETELLDMAGCDLRLHMLTGKVECIAGPTQFGLSFDKFGHRYGCSNRQPCFEILSERTDLGASPLAGLAGATSEVSPGESASKVYPLVNAWTTSNLHAGQFTAACGLLVSHSRHFGDAPFATALTCEPTGGLVQARSMTRQSGRSRVSDEPALNEWLASRDSWFRPVDLCEGPNGDIYVVDMYRAVIEHPEWVPDELKARPDQRFGDSHGRIYRVTRSAGEKGKREGIIQPDIAEWIKHEDTWNRNIASRLFLEAMHRERDEALIEKMRAIAREPFYEDGSISCACSLLASCDGLDEITVNSLYLSERRALAWTRLRQTTAGTSDQLCDEAMTVFGNEVATLDELRAAAWFIAAHVRKIDGSVDDFPKLFNKNAAKALLLHGDDAHLWMAISAACKGELSSLIENYHLAISESKNDAFPEVARDAIMRLALRVAQQGSELNVAEWLERYTQRSATLVNASSHQCTFAILEGFVRSGKVRVPSGSSFERLLLETSTSGVDPINQRSAIAMLSACSSDEAKRTCMKLLEGSDAKILKLAVATCSAHDTPEFGIWLLDRLPSAMPDIRQELFVAVKSKPSRLMAMLDRLESGAMSTRVFDASQMQSLRAIQDPLIAPRLTKVLAASINSNRQKVIDDYTQQLMSIHVDEHANRGKAIFEKNCAACHRLDSVGTIVGPDISDSRVQAFDKLLVSILDPNRSIDANYFRYLARTEDGKVIEGVMKDSNASTITLQNQNGSTILERSMIEELKSSGTSLMPEGIEAQIPASDMADLLWYIKNWRYTAEKIPANATIGK